MSKSISRTEHVDGGVRIISNDRFDGLQNELWRLDDELGIDTWTGNARVFWSGKTAGQSRWEFGSENVLYYNTDVKERELTDEEVEWCEDTFMYRGESMPDKLYYFYIPKPENLKKAIRKQDIDMIDGLTAKVQDKDTRQDLVESFQENIALNNYRTNQLSFDGHVHDLDPEWNPEHTDDDRRTTRDKASMRSDSYQDSWSDVFDLSYYKMKEARYQALGLHEPYITATQPSIKMIELGVLGKDNMNYCRACASVWPDSELLHPEVRGYDDRTMRVCENCADRRTGDLFNNLGVAKALDKRSIENGGQRRLHPEFLTVTKNN